MLIATLLLSLHGAIQPSPLNTYAVLDIANEKGELTALSSFIGDELSLRLGIDSGVSLVERGQLKKVLKEHNLQATGAIDESTIASMGKFLGATRIMTGQYYQMGDDYVAMVRVLDVTTGKVLRMSKVSFPKSTSTQSLAETILDSRQPVPNPATSSGALRPATSKGGPLQFSKCTQEVGPYGRLNCHGFLFAPETGKIEIPPYQNSFFLEDGHFLTMNSSSIGANISNDPEIPAGIKVNVDVMFDHYAGETKGFQSFKLKYLFAKKPYVSESSVPIELMEKQ